MKTWKLALGRSAAWRPSPCSAPRRSRSAAARSDRGMPFGAQGGGMMLAADGDDAPMRRGGAAAAPA